MEQSRVISITVPKAKLKIGLSGRIFVPVSELVCDSWGKRKKQLLQRWKLPGLIMFQEYPRYLP